MIKLDAVLYLTRITIQTDVMETLKIQRVLGYRPGVHISGLQVARENKFCTVAHYICGSSV
jgi:hypothetical protein